jgi:hypothetical protein
LEPAGQLNVWWQVHGLLEAVHLPEEEHVRVGGESGQEPLENYFLKLNNFLFK